MNREWGNEEGRSTLKTPTSILLRPNKEFDSFGYEADDKYVHFTRGEEKDYYYLKHFKMELHHSEVINIFKAVDASCGRLTNTFISPCTDPRQVFFLQ